MLKVASNSAVTPAQLLELLSGREDDFDLESDDHPSSFASESEGGSNVEGAEVYAARTECTS